MKKSKAMEKNDKAKYRITSHGVLEGPDDGVDHQRKIVFVHHKES